MVVQSILIAKKSKEAMCLMNKFEKLAIIPFKKFCPSRRDEN